MPKSGENNLESAEILMETEAETATTIRAEAVHFRAASSYILASKTTSMTRACSRRTRTSGTSTSHIPDVKFKFVSKSCRAVELNGNGDVVLRGRLPPEGRGS